ncbi:hypothetical protein DXG01_010773 [Tephrocybe rancida]|nr:hypothetical protein DXG01_010773 [Tephrocybe rancida]
MDTPSSVLQTLRRESLDIYNRLHSIADDASFVAHVHNFYPTIPLVPNLRCGAWYADPTIASSIPAYFKSTDGHNNNWGFNLRRANLHLLPLIAEHGSIVLVDSTRAGKRIPDALSKTVPIWCAVVNRAIIRRYPGPDKGSWDTALYTPAGAVSAQEHHQIELRIDAWAGALFVSRHYLFESNRHHNDLGHKNSSFDLPALSAPLRPFWITPATTTFPSIHTSSTSPFLPIICLSASRQSDDARRPGGFAYIQGSGDDHELWSMGLTPTHYWRHTSTLLSATRSDLPELIQKLISSDTTRVGDEDAGPTTGKDNKVTRVAKVHGRLRIGTYHDVERAGWNEDLSYVLLPANPDSPTPSFKEHTGHRLTVPLAPRIKSYLSQTILPRTLPFIGKELKGGRSVCVVCGGEKPGDAGDMGDEGIAVLLAALVVFFKGDGQLTSEGVPPSKEDVHDIEHISGDGNESTQEETMELEKVDIPVGIDKTIIRTRLEWIIACRPAINPARTTLKRLNEYLLSNNHTGRK